MGSGLVAQMAVDNYRDGLPLNRIGQQLAGLGVEVPSASTSTTTYVNSPSGTRHGRLDF